MSIPLEGKFRAVAVGAAAAAVVLLTAVVPVTANEPPTVVMEWWSPCYTIGATCSGGSPDGRPGTFTLSATASDDAGIAEYQWDFDGDGTVDETSTTNAISHVYAAGVYRPQVRVKDTDGALSAFDQKDAAACLGTCDLDVVNTAPTVVMEWWSPCYTIGATCSGGSPDGRPGTFTLSATASDDAGIAEYQWDFDGDGTVDETSTTNAISHVYAAGVYRPQVRVKDTDGALSAFDQKDAAACLGTCDLDVVNTAPTVVMEWWSPCYTIGATCSGGSPDGRPGTFTLSATASDDAGIAEYQWDFDGDGTVDETSTTNAISHVYAAGVYRPQVRVKDTDGALSAFDQKDAAACLGTCDLDVVEDHIADAGPDQHVSEGAIVALDGSPSSGSGQLTFSWHQTSGPAVALSGANTATPTFIAPDNGTFEFELTVTDGSDAQLSDSVTVQADNLPPVLGAIVGPTNAVAVASSVSISATFTDAGTADTHSAMIDWGDGTTSAGAVQENVGSGSASGTHTYATPGIRTITLTVTDDDGDDTSRTLSVVVVDLASGHITGSGWINAPAGSYLANPSLSGRAAFAFVAKYKTSGLSGQTEVAFGNMTFTSTSNEWLLVSAPTAALRGSGNVNGIAGYDFRVTARDGAQDAFRIQIWERASGEVLFDNMRGSAQNSDDAQSLGGGSIVIHR